MSGWYRRVLREDPNERTQQIMRAMDVASIAELIHLGVLVPESPPMISRRALVELLRENIRRGVLLGEPDREYRDILADLEVELAKVDA